MVDLGGSITSPRAGWDAREARRDKVFLKEDQDSPQFHSSIATGFERSRANPNILLTERTWQSWDLELQITQMKDELKRQILEEISIDQKTNSERYQYIIECQNQRIAALEERVKELEKTEDNDISLEDLWEISDRNLCRLQQIFGLPEILDSETENPFDKLRGVLKDCSDDEIDAVALVRSIRGQ